MYVHTGDDTSHRPENGAVGYWQRKLGVNDDGVYGPNTVDAVADATGTDGNFIGPAEASLIDPFAVDVSEITEAVWGKLTSPSNGSITYALAFNRIYGRTEKLTDSGIDELVADIVAGVVDQLPPGGDATPEEISAVVTPAVVSALSSLIPTEADIAEAVVDEQHSRLAD